MEEFETKKERMARQNRERVKRFQAKHNRKQFKTDFYGDEVNQILIPLLETLAKDGLTQKDFVVRSYKEYVKRGGFAED